MKLTDPWTHLCQLRDRVFEEEVRLWNLYSQARLEADNLRISVCHRLGCKGVRYDAYEYLGKCDDCMLMYANDREREQAELLTREMSQVEAALNREQRKRFVILRVMNVFLTPKMPLAALASARGEQ